MRTEHSSIRNMLACILGLAIGGFGCSDGGANEQGETTGGVGASGGTPVDGTGGSELAVTGGTMATGGQVAMGGLPGDGGTPPMSGGSATGGVQETGGAPLGTGGAATGGAATGGAATGGGGPVTGGAATGGAATGGAPTGGAATGGTPTGGATTGGAATGGAATGGVFTGTCTASEGTGRSASGSGPHDVVVETNSDDGINEGTIYRPADMGGAEKYPIFVWGNGACSRQGYSNATAMSEIASHGYFVVADGTPSGAGDTIGMSNDVEGMARPLLAYITWAIAENDKPCSAYYQSLDTTKIAANGFSCGGLMAAGTASDPRITTYGITSSGLTGSVPGFYESVHTPVLVILGGPSDIAYENGERDYDNISALGHPIMLFSKDIGHGGDLGSPNGGDFTQINLAWLNWWLKGDDGATGKGVLVGSGCTYCTDSAWEVKSANLP